MNRRELAKNGILSLCGFLASPEQAAVPKPEGVCMTWKTSPNGTYYAAGSTDPEWESVNADGI